MAPNYRGAHWTGTRLPACQPAHLPALSPVLPSLPSPAHLPPQKRHHPATLVCGGFLLVAAALVLVVVAPVCTTLGCPPKSQDTSAIAPEEQLVGMGRWGAGGGLVRWVGMVGTVGMGSWGAGEERLVGMGS